MAHVRQTVREAVGTILSVTPTNWNRVFETRIPPKRDVYPYLLVYCESEASSPLTIHPSVVVSRIIQITTVGHIRIVDSETLEDKFDALAAEIETKLTQTALNTQLSGKLRSLILTNTDFSIVTDDDRAYAEVALLWQAQIMSNEGAPETLI